jgi:hypothetical protein
VVIGAAAMRELRTGTKLPATPLLVMVDVSISDDISGNGAVIIDGAEAATVYYWLTISPKAGPLIAEGCISGSEELMRSIKKAETAKLVLEDGLTVVIRCRGGHSGTRWVKAFRT